MPNPSHGGEGFGDPFAARTNAPPMTAVHTTRCRSVDAGVRHLAGGGGCCEPAKFYGPMKGYGFDGIPILDVTLSFSDFTWSTKHFVSRLRRHPL
jgi:hypothetical protein